MAKPTKTRGLTQRSDTGTWTMAFTHTEPISRRIIKRYRLSLDVVAGRPIRDKADAIAVMEKTKTAIRENRFRGTLASSQQTAEDEKDAQGRTPLAQVTAEYIEHHVGAMAATTNIEGAVKRLARHLGDRPINGITTIDLDRYIKGLQKPEVFMTRQKIARTRTPGAVNQHVIRIGHFFRWAMQRGFIARSPLVDQAGKRIVKKVKGECPRDVTLTLDEQDQIIAKAAASVIPDAAKWIAFALDTGLRRGEQFGRWKRRPLGEFDETSGIRVRDWNPFTRKLTVRAEVAKTGKAREVPIVTERTQKILKEACAPEGVARHPEELIFVTIDGKPIWRESPIRRLRHACKAANVATTIHWHDLRHVFASDLYYQLGTPLQIIQKALGHSTIQMTMTYLNVSEAGIDAALSGFDALRKRKDTGKTREGLEVASGT